MRSNISSCSFTNQPYGLAAVYYPLANTNTVPKSVAYNDTSNPCGNDDLVKTVPFYPIPVVTPTITQSVDINFFVNSTGHFLWTMNGQSFRGDYNAPVLLLSASGNNSYPMNPEWNVYNMGAATSFRFNITNLTPLAHPMHLHGHNMQVLSEGLGVWNGTITRPSNPTRRDVQLLQPGGYMVWQVTADNPGVWPFHCVSSP
jgi:FtsP/CotA-like multicopper oxidase with cupredoxin domain